MYHRIKYKYTIEMEESGHKRKPLGNRCPNFTSEERILIASLVDEKKAIVESKKTDGQACKVIYVSIYHVLCWTADRWSPLFCDLLLDLAWLGLCIDSSRARSLRLITTLIVP